MPTIHDGPSSPHFRPLPFVGNAGVSASAGLSDQMSAALDAAPSGSCVCWGIPFEIGEPVILADRPVTVEIAPPRARWLVFMHTSDLRPLEPEAGRDHLADARRGPAGRARGRLRDPLRRRQRGAGRDPPPPPDRRLPPALGRELLRGGRASQAPSVRAPATSRLRRRWGWSQTRVVPADDGPWMNWLWAWENPHPEKAIAGLRFEPVGGAVVVSAISAGDVVELPLRWQPRRKALPRAARGRGLRAGPGRGRAARPDPARPGPGDLRHAAAALPERRLGGRATTTRLPELCRPRGAGRVHRPPRRLLPPRRPAGSR